ncbi:signal transduction histidine kinase [Microbacterium endophyticum]|uniref:histidine kinase n=1 Tax=Microbacterium endophyticum TaxID=1526412 RepID=A0A7W4YMJ1_9MICO|nr:ATP-binding protein [Microbacterium endophyticum]MBB2976253.1 signal transduction histidine kinase [Microbacterium endophyticum]NIK35133.1 signal transduction histidine kinase [Microbacterium endophyticum]
MGTAQDFIRREAISTYRVVGEPADADLQGLVRLATLLCDVPVAVINIIDEHSQHQIAAVGIDRATCAREDSLCSIVIEQKKPLVIADASADEALARHPFVDGTLARVRFYASSPLITPEGVAIGTLCLFDSRPRELSLDRREALDLLAGQVMDVLELRRITYELFAANDRLERFAAQVTHDLSNPLSAVTGFIELAADAAEATDAPDVMHALRRADAASVRMARMLADLLNYVRVGPADREVKDIKLAYVIQEALDDLATVITESHVSVMVEANESIVADEMACGVLFQNLIANAIKFARATREDPLVEIRAVPITAGVRITIDDNGPGIAPDQRERVFGLMERGDNHDLPGLGLGLSTCRRIVEGHGGSIGITESPLGGARFSILFPRSTSAA